MSARQSESFAHALKSGQQYSVVHTTHVAEAPTSLRSVQPSAALSSTTSGLVAASLEASGAQFESPALTLVSLTAASGGVRWFASVCAETSIGVLKSSMPAMSAHPLIVEMTDPARAILELGRRINLA
jgi:hypothetical protein